MPLIYMDVVASVCVILAALVLLMFGFSSRQRQKNVTAFQKKRYETLYNAAATPLLVVDLGQLQQKIQLLEVVDADSLRDYLSFLRERGLNLKGLCEVKEVNRAARELFAAPGREALLSHLNHFLTSRDVWVNNMRSKGSDEGILNVDFELIVPALDARPISLLVNAALPIRLNASPSLNERAEGQQASLDEILITLTDRSDRVQLKERMVQAEGFWKKIVQSVPDLVYVNNPQEKSLLYANRELGELLGYSAQEIAAMPACYWVELVHPEDEPLITEALNNVHHLADDEVQETRFRMRHQRGEYRWMYFRNMVFERDANGNISKLLGLGKDIHQQTQARKEVERSEQHYRLLSENMTDVVWTTDRNFVLNYISPSVTGLFGRAPQALLNRRLTALFDSEQVAMFSQHIKAQLRRHLKDRRSVAALQKEVYQLEVSTRNAKGEAIVVELDLSFLLDQGRIVGTMGVCRDITARRKAEHETRLAAGVFESSTEAILVTNANGEVIQGNKAFYAITGRPVHSVLGVPLINALQLEERRAWDAVSGSLADHGFWQNEAVVMNAHAQAVPVWMGVTAIHNEAGELVSHIIIFSDISERKANEAAIHRLAFYDDLTGLANRSLMTVEIEDRVTEAQKRGDHFALLYLDLDRFKPVNDSLGHAAGDELLSEVAERLKTCVRKDDLVARMGGDEFTLLLQSARDVAKVRKAAIHVARKVLAQFEKPFEIEERELYVSASIGVAVYPEHGAERTTLMKNADTAMYHAKEKGRNNFKFYAAELNARAIEKLELESGLRRALELDQLRITYQPQLAVHEDGAVGVEALIRWHHPEKGVLSPDQFIPIAEESGLIVPIGEWVLRQACLQLRAWDRSGVNISKVSVNLSARQFQDSNLVDLVEDVLLQTGVKPYRLELEITESMLMDDVQHVLDTLNTLKKIGVRISIDDFGTGYSSLSYLRQFPLDTLKIDKSFIQSLPGEKNDEQIVEAIVAIAHGLNLGVIAEGVETRDQEAFLARLGCQEVQGYLYGKAMSPEHFVELFDSGSLCLSREQVLH